MQHNETILSLHYCKLLRGKNNKSADEWMNQLRIKANEINYRQLKSNSLMA